MCDLLFKNYDILKKKFLNEELISKLLLESKSINKKSQREAEHSSSSKQKVILGDVFTKFCIGNLDEEDIKAFNFVNYFEEKEIPDKNTIYIKSKMNHSTCLCNSTFNYDPTFKRQGSQSKALLPVIVDIVN